MAVFTEKNKTVLCFLCCFISVFQTFASDTLRMMQYNLMYYTLSAPSDCAVSENYLTNKEIHLKKIVQYVKPDVVCVNEIGSRQTYIDRILNNVFNSDGITHFSACPLTNYSGGSIANMLYYDDRKLSFHSHFYITTSYRDINAYRMYYKSKELAQGDTVFITFIVAHLAAGNNVNSENSRETQTLQLMERLEQLGKADNYIFSGDFNLYGASEKAYQTLLYYPNSLFQFIDPIDREGEWHYNRSFSDIHTQSTHTYSDEGECFASGGMDDRFDFILVSSYIFYGLKGVQSMNRSYHALGQDGNRFRNTIVAPANQIVPQEIANALYNISDHLPVILDFEITASPLSVDFHTTDCHVEVNNPVQDELKIFLYLDKTKRLQMELYSIEGKLLETFTEEFSFGHTTFTKPFPYSSGLYLFVVTDYQKNRIVKKVVNE